MIGRICYDPLTHQQIVVFFTYSYSLLLSNDGMSNMDQFMARNAAEIQSHFNDDNNDQRLLTSLWLSHLCRMSLRSVSHCYSQQCLLEYMPESKPVLYWRMMQSVTDSLLDPNLTIKERIAKMWYGVFLVRIWRSWLSENIICLNHWRFR